MARWLPRRSRPPRGARTGRFPAGWLVLLSLLLAGPARAQFSLPGVDGEGVSLALARDDRTRLLEESPAP